MRILNTPQLRLGQLQMFSENVVEICSGLVPIEGALNLVSTKLQTFITGMLKQRSAGVDKVSIDKARDLLTSGFMSDIRAENRFPHQNEAVKKVIEDLNRIITKYGADIVRLPFNEETVAIDNLLEEINALNLDVLSDTGITRWLPLVEEANNEFKAATTEFIDVKADIAAVDSASSIVPELLNALDQLFVMLFSNYNVAPSDDLLEAYNKLEQLIVSMN